MGDEVQGRGVEGRGLNDHKDIKHWVCRIHTGWGLLQVGVDALRCFLPAFPPTPPPYRAACCCCCLPQAKVLKDLTAVTLVVITLREEFPGANVSALLRVKPKLLLQQPGALRADAEKVWAKGGRGP
jgi:hypothetical protein